MRTVQFGFPFVASPLGDATFSGITPESNPVIFPVPLNLAEIYIAYFFPEIHQLG